MIDVFFLYSVAYFKVVVLVHEILYPARKSWMLASVKLYQNIYSFALELDTIIESVLREGAQMTAVSAMVTSIYRLVSPSKKLFVWTMIRGSSCSTLNPPTACATLMSFLENTKEGRASKST